MANLEPQKFNSNFQDLYKFHVDSIRIHVKGQVVDNNMYIILNQNPDQGLT